MIWLAGLAMSGRGTESAKLLEEARGLARGLKNDALTSAPFEY